MNVNAVIAVFKRNLAAYFGSPAGYVFICAFLLACGFAAFWTQEFFNANRANLDQLNKFLPHILLGFIPAITMSIWADERRQGTDELLLTLPGSDLDVVLGKYLGAVAIFTVSLVLSLVSNAMVLGTLGEPDLGLLFANYIGYWFVGLAMLAIGMVASFLTANLTVAFVLGVAFNAPLALLSDWSWSIAENYRDFAQGVISLSSIVFFLSLAAAMLYLCAILIGRRNWMGNENSASRIGHYSSRIIAALVIGGASTFFFRNHDVIRYDATAEELSKLSPESIKLLNKVKGTVTIEAYVSPEEDFPQEYEQTRINLLNMLRELEGESSGKVRVKEFIIESFDSAAQTAEEDGITNMDSENLYVEEDGIGGAWDKDIYMGLVFKGAAGKKRLDFLYKGLPVEYELMRNILAAGSSDEKKKIGVISTEAPVLGSGPSMGPMGMMTMNEGTPPWEFVQELRKQYEVTEANVEAPIRKEDFDALLVIQPSALDNAKLNVLLNAIRSGIPTAVFEDPSPFIFRNMAGTFEPLENNQQGGPGQPPPPPREKCNLYSLWDLLSINFNTNGQERLDTVVQELEKLEKKARDELEAFSAISAVSAFFSELDALQAKSKSLVTKIKKGIPVTRQEASINLETLRSTVSKLDSNHFARRFVEAFINDTYSRFQGLEKRILRDRFNPFPKIPKVAGSVFTDEFVYAGGAPSSFSDDNVTSSLQYLLFTYAGALFDAEAKKTDGKTKKFTFTPLVRTRGDENAGTTSLNDFTRREGGIFGREVINPDRTLYDGNGKSYVIAAEVKENKAGQPIHAIIVADTDFLTDAFFGIRKQPNPGFPLDVDNVTFALNIAGKLLGEKEMMAIRNRRRAHAPLEDLEKIKLEAGWKAEEEGRKAQEAFRDKLSEKRKDMNKEIAKVIIDDQGQLISKGGTLTTEQNRRIRTIETQGNAGIDTIIYQEQRKLKQATREVKRKRRNDIGASQSQIKNLAVFLPPIPLLIVAFIVFARKRHREMEGTATSRIRGE